MTDHSRRNRGITVKLMGKTMDGAERLKVKVEGNEGAIMDTILSHSGMLVMIDSFYHDTAVAIDARHGLPGRTMQKLVMMYRGLSAYDSDDRTRHS